MKEPKAACVFGLSESQLRPVVEAAVGESVEDFAISIEHELEGDPGFAADKLIPTFNYVTAGGRRGASPSSRSMPIIRKVRRRSITASWVCTRCPCRAFTPW